jgi:serine/threonine protein kinase
MSLAGETLGEYRIERLIGHGTMAEVYLAAHIAQGYPAAIKIIHEHLLMDPNFIDRFRREAKILSDLDHPHITHIYGYEFFPKQAYIVMEYLGGGTLADRLKICHEHKENLPLSDVLAIIEPISSATDYAHEHGLIHRDIKPANILFRENHDPVLTDFGLAFVMSDPRLSASNTITGTPAYLSPEQAKGNPGDSRSDVYALGVVLYEMLSGFTPFQGNVISVVMKHISEPPPSIRSFGRYLPRRIEDVVLKALEKQPHQRYQSAQMMARDFRKAIEKTVPEALLPETESIILKEWDAAKQDNLESEVIEEAGQNETLPPSEVAIVEQPVFDIKESESAQTAPLTKPEQRRRTLPMRRPAVGTVRLEDLRDLTQPGRRRGSQWPAFLYTLGILVMITAFLIFVLPSIIGAIQPPGEPPLPAKYDMGQQLSVTIPGGMSTSVYDGCRSLLSGRVVGMASDGQAAIVRSRKPCSDDWYYEVFIKEAASKEWDGIGYLPSQFLR